MFIKINNLFIGLIFLTCELFIAMFMIETENSLEKRIKTMLIKITQSLAVT